MGDKDFGWALNQLWDGNAVARHGWNGKSQMLRLQRPDDNSLMTLPYIYIFTVTRDRVPWLASQTDLLSGDWYVAEVGSN